MRRGARHLHPWHARGQPRAHRHCFGAGPGWYLSTPLDDTDCRALAGRLLKEASVQPDVPGLPTLQTPATTYIAAWRRPGAEAATTLRLPHLRGSAARVDVLYPSASRAAPVWNAGPAELTLPTAPSAVLLRIAPSCRTLHEPSAQRLIRRKGRAGAPPATKERSGWLTLRARGGSLDERGVVFASRRQQHLSCRARTLVDPASGRGGLAVRLDERHHYEIEASATDVRVIARVGSLRTVVASQPLPTGPAVVLGINIPEPPAAHDARTGPDVVSLGIEELDGTFTELATLGGRYLSTEVAGGFTGQVIGMYAAEGSVHFDWFDYEALAP